MYLVKMRLALDNETHLLLFQLYDLADLEKEGLDVGFGGGDALCCLITEHGALVI